MDERIFKLTVGGLLHDVGKVIYRTGRGKNHGDLGADYLLQELQIQDEEILNQVRLHHVGRLRKANVSSTDLAYITCMADNISSGLDRRKFEEGVEPELQGYHGKYDRWIALQSIFNVFENESKKSETAKEYEPTEQINGDGITKLTNCAKYSYEFYKKLHNDFSEELKKIERNKDYVNSILTIVEKYYSYIPCSSLLYDIEDISLYSHSKLTAALGCCIYKYLECGQQDYKYLADVDSKFYTEEAFLYYTFDISGIQDFIYTIHSDGALKNLRVRSFYLEILVEHIVDEILAKLGLSRANLLYTGGGHAQMILPNTVKTKNVLKEISNGVNEWLRKKFDIKLYFADAYFECCANELMKEKHDSFCIKLEKMQETLQEKKFRRYTATELEELNNSKVNGDRECKVCHHSEENIKENGECSLCENFRELSNRILNPETGEKKSKWENKEVFLIMKSNTKEERCLPLPFDKYLYFVTNEDFNKKYADTEFVRVYTKNTMKIGCRHETHLWIGDYNRYNTLKENADHAVGIRRIGVLRADVDNLGSAFTEGFSAKYDTFSRKTMLSESLSLFFKFYLNYFMEHGNEQLKEKEKERAITVVYSGGDDVFVIGSWDDVIGFAIDLHNEFAAFTQNKLTLSAGIGIYQEKYPVSRIAYEVGNLEECAKLNGKDSVSLFTDEFTFKWDVFIHEIYEKKYRLISSFFEGNEERGTSFLYHLLDLLKAIKESEIKDINLARYAFLLARLEPGKNDMQKKKEYQDFASQMYAWTKNKKDVTETIVAIYMYLYSIRKGERNGKSELYEKE